MGRFYLPSDHLWFTHAVGENIKQQNSTTIAQKLCHAEEKSFTTITKIITGERNKKDDIRKGESRGWKHLPNLLSSIVFTTYSSYQNHCP